MFRIFDRRKNKDKKMNKFYNKKNIIHKNKIPKDVLFMVEKLEKSGFVAFLVGGCIRDLLLKRIVRDWDILTNAAPKQIKKVFYEYKTIVIGKNSLTVTVILNHKAYQISSLRNSHEQKLPDNKEISLQKLKEDLMSRDFTINSLCWNQSAGMFDPADGLKDLRHKIIRSNSPDLRFKEDPLRMLRAIRLYCELGFSIETNTKKSINRNVFLIQQISPERIRNEIILILNSSKIKRGVLLLYHYGFFCNIFSLDRIKKIQTNREKLNNLLLLGLETTKNDLPFQLTLLGRVFYDSCEIASIFYFPIIKYLKFKKKIAETVKLLLSREWECIDFSSDIKIRFILAEFGEENTRRLFLLKKTLLEQGQEFQKNNLKIEESLLEGEIKKKPPVKLGDLAISGDEVRKMGISEGKEIGKILKGALKEIIINPDYNNEEYLVKYIKKVIKKNDFLV